jgi:hypothetical protein
MKHWTDRPMQPARSEYWSPSCAENDCDQPAQYRIRGRRGDLLFGERCLKHANELVDKLNAEKTSGGTDK